MSPRPEAVENVPDVIAEAMERTEALAPIIDLRNQCKEVIKRVSESLDCPISSASSSLRHAETAAGIFTGEEDDWPPARLVGFFLDGNVDGEDSMRTAVHPIMQIGKRNFLLAGRDFKKVYGIAIDEERKKASIRNCEPLNGDWTIHQRITQSYGQLALVVPHAEHSIITMGVVLDKAITPSTDDFLDVITGGSLAAMYDDARRGVLQGTRFVEMRTKLSVVGKISEGLRLASE